MQASVQYPDGRIEPREQGTPQGGVISPLLANLYLHYAFDSWVEKYSKGIQFERYADDIVCHCRTEQEAIDLQAVLKDRFKVCGLELHPGKTKIVYCQDGNRSEKHKLHSFDFLGFCFRPRLSRNKYGRYFVNFLPAIAPKSKKVIFSEIRMWSLHRRTC